MSVTQFMPNATLHLHRHDLPDGVRFNGSVAVDTETMGLNPHRDRLCLVQLCGGSNGAADNQVHLVQIIPASLGGPTLANASADCPNLKAVLSDPAVLKLMHFARFDVGILQHALDITVAPVRCTKIAAKLVRTFTERHGLRELCRDLLGIDLNKQQQTSDWGAASLTPEQLAYAASDVLHLHALWERLEGLLKRENRLDLALAAYDFLPARARLDMLGYKDPDLFAH